MEERNPRIVKMLAWMIVIPVGLVMAMAGLAVWLYDEGEQAGRSLVRRFSK